jgi:hypothetical protein
LTGARAINIPLLSPEEREHYSAGFRLTLSMKKLAKSNARQVVNQMGLLWATLELIFHFAGTAQAVLPQDMHYMAVLIQIPDPANTNLAFTGTGVYLRQSNGIFLVTARHVIFNGDHKTLKNTNALFSSFSPNGVSTATIDLAFLNAKGDVKCDPSHDIAAVRTSIPAGDGTNFISYRYAVQMTNTTKVWDSDTNCQPSNRIFEGDDALILGYPTELFTERLPNDIDFAQPLIRKGTISQKPSTNDRFIIDSGVFGGNSGGPFLVNETSNYVNVANQSVTVVFYKLGGLMVRFVPASTRVFPNSGITNSILVYSGYSVAEPIEAVLRLLSTFK